MKSTCSSALFFFFFCTLAALRPSCTAVPACQIATAGTREPTIPYLFSFSSLQPHNFPNFHHPHPSHHKHPTLFGRFFQQPSGLFLRRQCLPTRRVTTSWSACRATGPTRSARTRTLFSRGRLRTGPAVMPAAGSALATSLPACRTALVSRFWRTVCRPSP